MYLIRNELFFPDPRNSNEEGIVAIGGDLSVARLMLAYNSGIFPWFNEDEPIIWWSPPLRMVLFPEELKISKSMKQVLKKKQFKATFNSNFEAVITQCAQVRTQQGEETWITSDMIKAYTKLHLKGYAKSVEVWDEENNLVGGLYGIDLVEKRIFCGESMFSLKSNASKVAFIALTTHLQALGYILIDCQMHTDHLERLGAREITREVFLKYL